MKMMDESWLVIDGQWGSTGKGLMCGWLATYWCPTAVVCNFGPNAGHTVIVNGKRVVTSQLPTGIISKSVKDVFIGPGSIIYPETLLYEINKYKSFLEGKNLFIHESACIVSDYHKIIEENTLNRIASTCKGTGAAYCDKIMRKEGSIVLYCDELKRWVVDQNRYYDRITNAKSLQIESSQGLELGINSGGWFPYCTSRDVNVYQILSDCGLPNGVDPTIVCSMRTYPIRVGGNSGPVYDDQVELAWEQIGVEPELTTVTKKIRRVFSWSWDNLDKVINVINPDNIFLNFMNYLNQEDATDLRDEIHSFYGDIIRWLGFGPHIADVIEV